MRKRLTKMTLEQRAPNSGRLEVRDTDSPLIFRLTSAGNRSLCVRERIGGNGQPQRFTYPKSAIVENLAEARHWAYQTVDACKTGQDPRDTKEAKDAAAVLEAERTERLKCKHILSKTRAVGGDFPPLYPYLGNALGPKACVQQPKAASAPRTGADPNGDTPIFHIFFMSLRRE